jgi:hypothetical protein
MKMAPTDRIRGQARFYSGFGSSPNFAFDTTSVGAGLLANAVDQATVMAPTDRVRGQARSYSGLGSSPNFAFDTTSVGAGLLANAVDQATTLALAERGGPRNGDAADRSRSRASALLQWVG